MADLNDYWPEVEALMRWVPEVATVPGEAEAAGVSTPNLGAWLRVRGVLGTFAPERLDEIDAWVLRHTANPEIRPAVSSALLATAARPLILPADYDALMAPWIAAVRYVDTVDTD